MTHLQSKLPITVISKTSREAVRAPNEANKLHRLPAEILNIIFWYLWSHYSIIWTKSAGMQFLLSFVDGIFKHLMTSSCGLPTWLLVCKMFLYEGRAMLSRMARITGELECCALRYGGALSAESHWPPYYRASSQLPKVGEDSNRRGVTVLASTDNVR